ncbi:unnamed protein product [Effrenium voratum]|nr:unnamed protein product [Effrenium voratum]
MATLELHCDGPVLGLAYAPEANVLLSCTSRQLAAWECSTGQCLRGMQSRSVLQALTYASHLQCAIVGGRDGSILVWDISTGAAKREMSCGSAVSCLDYALSLKAVVSGEENGTVVLWDLTRGVQLAVIWCHAMVHCLSYWFIPPYIRDIPHLDNGEILQKLIPATENGTMGRAIVTGDSAFKVTVWDMETCKAKKVLHCQSHVLALATSPFLGLVAAGEANGHVTIWDVEIEQVLHRLEGGGLRGLTFVSLEEVQTLMAAESMRLVSWDIDTGQFRSRRLPRGIHCATCLCEIKAEEGCRLALGDSAGLVTLLPHQEATRGFDAKRAGDGVRLRSCLRT